MSLTRFRANLAVLCILRSRGVPAQGRLGMAELRARWPAYALRSRDLDRSLQRLESLGLVRQETDGGRPMVVLTAEGYRWTVSVMSLVEVLLVLPRKLRKWLDESRADAQVPRRRLVDRAQAEPLRDRRSGLA